MERYVLLLRGINVGGKNKLPMAELRTWLEQEGFKHVATYIQSGNIILQSELSADEIQRWLEKALPKNFELDSPVIRVLVLSLRQIQSVVRNKPEGFGDTPGKFHSDVIFLMGIDAKDAVKAFSTKEGVDMLWPGDGVIYSQRLSAMRTKSRLNKIMSSPLYQSMTIRNWNTTTKLLSLVSEQ